LIDGLGNNDLVGGDGYDIIAAYSGLNTLTGGAANDFITGGINADIIDAGSGNDVIIGDAGRNIYGSSDQIEGGTGNDTMMGGNGADTFVFHPNDGNDVIADFIAPDVSRNSAGTLSVASFGEDFQSGLDEIHLIGFQSVGSNNVMSFITDTAQGAKFQAEGTTILFYGVATSDLSVDDFVFV
jgi:Ca2+-binding RTX toxin-like protein